MGNSASKVPSLQILKVTENSIAHKKNILPFMHTILQINNKNVTEDIDGLYIMKMWEQHDIDLCIRDLRTNTTFNIRIDKKESVQEGIVSGKECSVQEVREGVKKGMQEAVNSVQEGVKEGMQEGVHNNTMKSGILQHNNTHNNTHDMKIGISVKYYDDILDLFTVYIIKIIHNSSAHKCGLLKHDYILGIENVSSENANKLLKQIENKKKQGMNLLVFNDKLNFIRRVFFQVQNGLSLYGCLIGLGVLYNIPSDERSISVEYNEEYVQERVNEFRMVYTDEEEVVEGISEVGEGMSEVVERGDGEGTQDLVEVGNSEGMSKVVEGTSEVQESDGKGAVQEVRDGMSVGTSEGKSEGDDSKVHATTLQDTEEKGLLQDTEGKSIDSNSVIGMSELRSGEEVKSQEDSMRESSVIGMSEIQVNEDSGIADSTVKDNIIGVIEQGTQGSSTNDSTKEHIQNDITQEHIQNDNTQEHIQNDNTQEHIQNEDINSNTTLGGTKDTIHKIERETEVVDEKGEQSTTMNEEGTERVEEYESEGNSDSVNSNAYGSDTTHLQDTTYLQDTTHIQDDIKQEVQDITDYKNNSDNTSVVQDKECERSDTKKHGDTSTNMKGSNDRLSDNTNLSHPFIQSNVFEDVPHDESVSHFYAEHKSVQDNDLDQSAQDDSIQDDTENDSTQHISIVTTNAVNDYTTLMDDVLSSKDVHDTHSTVISNNEHVTVDNELNEKKQQTCTHMDMTDTVHTDSTTSHYDNSVMSDSVIHSCNNDTVYNTLSDDSNNRLVNDSNNRPVNGSNNRPVNGSNKRLVNDSSEDTSNMVIQDNNHSQYEHKTVAMEEYKSIHEQTMNKDTLVDTIKDIHRTSVTLQIGEVQCDEDEHTDRIVDHKDEHTVNITDTMDEHISSIEDNMDEQKDEQKDEQMDTQMDTQMDEHTVSKDAIINENHKDKKDEQKGEKDEQDTLLQSNTLQDEQLDDIDTNEYIRVDSTNVSSTDISNRNDIPNSVLLEQQDKDSDKKSVSVDTSIQEDGVQGNSHVQENSHVQGSSHVQENSHVQWNGSIIDRSSTATSDNVQVATSDNTIVNTSSSINTGTVQVNEVDSSSTNNHTIQENTSTVQENDSTVQEGDSTVQLSTSTVQENGSTVQDNTTNNNVHETTDSTVQENTTNHTVQENDNTYTSDSMHTIDNKLHVRHSQPTDLHNGSKHTHIQESVTKDIQVLPHSGYDTGLLTKSDGSTSDMMSYNGDSIVQDTHRQEDIQDTLVQDNIQQYSVQQDGISDAQDTHIQEEATRNVDTHVQDTNIQDDTLYSVHHSQPTHTTQNSTGTQCNDTQDSTSTLSPMHTASGVHDNTTSPETSVIGSRSSDLLTTLYEPHDKQVSIQDTSTVDNKQNVEEYVNGQVHTTVNNDCTTIQGTSSTITDTHTSNESGSTVHRDTSSTFGTIMHTIDISNSSNSSNNSILDGSNSSTVDGSNSNKSHGSDNDNNSNKHTSNENSNEHTSNENSTEHTTDNGSIQPTDNCSIYTTDNTTSIHITDNDTTSNSMIHDSNININTTSIQPTDNTTTNTSITDDTMTNTSFDKDPTTFTDDMHKDGFINEMVNKIYTEYQVIRNDIGHTEDNPGITILNILEHSSDSSDFDLSAHKQE